MNTALSAFLVLTAGLQAPAQPQLTLSSPSGALTWNEVHGFLLAHAAPMDYDTESMLRAEAEAGIRTWTKCIPGSGSSAAASTSFVDGPGMGWPAAAHVLRFPTTQERDLAAGLVEAFTICSAKS